MNCTRLQWWLGCFVLLCLPAFASGTLSSGWFNTGGDCFFSTGYNIVLEYSTNGGMTWSPVADNSRASCGGDSENDALNVDCLARVRIMRFSTTHYTSENVVLSNGVNWTCYVEVDVWESDNNPHLVSIAWTGTEDPAPPTYYTNYVHGFCLTNLTGLYDKWLITTTNTDLTTSTGDVWVKPNKIECWNVTNDIRGIRVERAVYRPWDEQTDPNNPAFDLELLASQAGTELVSTNDYDAPLVSTSTSGNLWTDSQAEVRLGAQPAITNVVQSRTDVTASTGDTLNRDRESNDEQRHAELKSLLVNADRAEARRDAINLDTLTTALDRLSIQNRLGDLLVADAIGGLAGALTNGVTAGMGLTNGAGTIIGTNLGGFSGDAYASSLTNLLPGFTVPSEPDVVFEIPLTALHDDLEPVELDFGSEDLASVITLIRNFFLFVVTVGFFYASARLVGRAAGV